MKSSPVAKSTIFVGAITAMLLGACAKEEPKPEVIRPVRTMTVARESGDVLTLAGDVRPRYETALAFRVPGQIIERRAEVGAVVTPGQVLAVLDATDLKLAQSAATARLTQAESQATLAQAEHKRYTELRAQNFISQAEFDRRDTQVKQALESVAAARAEFSQIANQVGYGTLVAPHAGVIASIEIDVGRVVAAGQPVARLARQDEKEIAVSVPENLLPAVKTAKIIEIRLWSKPGATYQGRLREISPIADPASRTYPARLSIVGGTNAIAFGMSAEVRVVTNGAESIRVPLTALFHQQDRPAVWVVEGTPLAARLAPVTTGAVHGNSVEIAAGLVPDQLIVTAGVHMLTAGQRVRLLGETKLVGAPQ